MKTRVTWMFLLMVIMSGEYAYAINPIDTIERMSDGQFTVSFLDKEEPLTVEDTVRKAEALRLLTVDEDPTEIRSIKRMSESTYWMSYAGKDPTGTDMKRVATLVAFLLKAETGAQKPVVRFKLKTVELYDISTRKKTNARFIVFTRVK